MTLSDSPTPLTDALIQRNCQGGYWDANFNTEACKLLRDLERKLSAAIAEQNRLNEYYQYEAIKLRHTTEERDEAKRQNAVLRKVLKNLVPLASIHQAQPEDMTETDFYNLIVALSSARAALAATEKKP